MRVQDLMSHPAITCEPNDTLAIAAQRMWEHDCGAIAVVRDDDGVLCGVITDRDICLAAYAQARPLEEILVNGVMAKHVISARAAQPLDEVIELMAAHRVRRIPVIDADARPIGVLSLDDLAIESVQPDTRMPNAFSHVAHTLAAICRRRAPSRGTA